jgi:hypothetical protein
MQTIANVAVLNKNILLTLGAEIKQKVKNMFCWKWWV